MTRAFFVGMAVGALLALFIVHAAAASRPAPSAIPATDGYAASRGSVSGNPSARTAAPTSGVRVTFPSSPTDATRSAGREAVPDRKPSGITTPVAPSVRRLNAPAGVTGRVAGVASWYAAPAGTAAAGPSLRTALGPGWRGQRVRLCALAGCATVVLSDWMRRDRLVDLNRDAFRAVCGPLSRGVCRVTVP